MRRLDMHLLGPCRWSPAQVDAVLQTAGLPATSRVGVEKYLSVYTPKVLMVAPNRALYWTANTSDIAKARARAAWKTAGSAAAASAGSSWRISPRSGPV